MQFTISTVALVASMMAAQAEGSPIPGAGNMCGTIPDAAGSQMPLQSPAASTADACKKACGANQACKSFAFGLPPNAHAPVCKLFPVAGAHVTAQATNVKVFDLGCTNVSSQPPTAAHPVGPLKRGQVCGAKPTGGAARQPLLTVSVDTAEQCQATARKENSCQSFTFGLPADADAPVCRLYAVPAAQAPTQETNLVAFDLGCDDVPTTQPTRAQPVGLLDLSVSLDLLQGATAQPAAGQQQQGQDQKQQGGSSKPSNSDGKSTATADNAAPKTSGYSTQNGAASQPDSGSQASADNSQDAKNSQQTGNSYPTSSDGKSSSNSGTAGSSPANNNSNNSNNSNSYQTQAIPASASTIGKKCGVAPVGAAANAPAPLKTDASILTVDACLALGKATGGCLSVQFGKTSGKGTQECRLFGVSASILPAVSDDKNAIVYDVAC